jgi:hypothetical protein
MLTGRRCDESGRQTVQQELEQKSSILSKSRWWSKSCFEGSAEGISIGVVAVTNAISIAVVVSVAVAAVTAAAAAAVYSTASYSL